jgi:hypothetical protein
VRVSDLELEFDPLDVRRDIEDGLIPTIERWRGSQNFDCTMYVVTPGVRDALLEVSAWNNTALVHLYIPIDDLPHPPESEGDEEDTDTDTGTYLRDYAPEYEEYADFVIETVTTELGLKDGVSIADACDGDPRFFQEGLSGDELTGRDSLTHTVPFALGFRADAFFELDRLEPDPEAE